MKQFIFITLIGLIFASCTKERLTGNGDVITESRSISGFTAVRSSGSTDIHIAYGPTFRVEVRGSSNLIPRYKTRVINNTLEVGYENVWNVHRDDIEVFVTMPAVNSVALSGSGKVTIGGNFPRVESFRVSISGSGQAEMLDGFDCRYLSANLSGSGKAKLTPLIAQEADVTVSGSGGVWLTATEQLKVKISGSGDVYYSGSPRIEEHISGSGDIRKM